MSELRHRTDTAPTFTCAACLVQCARWHATRRATRAIGALTAKNLSTLTDASGSGTPTTLVSPHLLSAGALDVLLHCNTRVAQRRATSRNLAQRRVARHQAAWHHTETCLKRTHCWLPTVCWRAIVDWSSLSFGQVHHLFFSPHIVFCCDVD